MSGATCYLISAGLVVGMVVVGSAICIGGGLAHAACVDRWPWTRWLWRIGVGLFMGAVTVYWIIDIAKELCEAAP